MSYSRWSNSHWYSFYNVNGKLSLWHSINKTTDWEADDLKDITEQEIIEHYGCSVEDAKEAMKYIGYFLEEYEPNDPAVIEYRRQEAEFLKSLEEKND